MIIPPLTREGCLPPGVHTTSLKKTLRRFRSGSAQREGLGALLNEVVQAADFYPTIKRILVWGSFVTSKPEPNDLDYSLVVGVGHRSIEIELIHARFLVPIRAKIQYGSDPGFLILQDNDLSSYTDRLDFISRKSGQEIGIIELCIRGERSWEE